MRFSNSLYTGLKFFITVSFFYRSDSELEAKLQKKDEVIAEIAEENMLLKKLLVAGARERKG